MKKNKIIIISIISAVLVLGVAGGIYAIIKHNQSPLGPGGMAFSGKRRQPDFGQPDRQPDVRGVVKSIVGNEITILKIDLPSRNSSSTPDNTATKEKTAVNLTGSAPMAGGPSGMGGRPGEDNTDTRAQMLAKLKAMSTGEEKIIIPIGIQMLKFDTTSGQREPVEATLADITADKNITIWTSSAPASVMASTTATTTSSNSGKKIAEFVLIN
jgi:hypothetical protein